MKLKEPKLTIIELIFLIIVITCSQLSNQNPIMMVLAVVMFIYTLIFPSYKIFLALMFLLGSAENLNFYKNVTIHTAVVAVFWIRTICRIIYLKKWHLDEWRIVSIVIIMFGILNYKLTNSFSQLVTSFKGYAFLNLAYDSLNKEKNNDDIFVEKLYANSIRYLGCGLIISAIISFFNGSAISSVMRFSFGENTTINMIGIQCAVVVISLLYIVITREENHIIDYIILFGCSFIVLLTMSKTAILMIVIGLTLEIIFSLLKKGNYKLLLVIITLLFFGYLMYNYNYTIHNYVDKILIRFSAADISNGRYDLWNQTINNMKDNTNYFLFGAGDYINIGAVGGKNNKIYMAHNFILETWVIYGIIGTFLIVLQYWLFIKKVFIVERNINIINGNILNWVPIVSFMAGLFYSHHFLGRPNCLLVIISFIPIFINRTNNIKENINEKT